MDVSGKGRGHCCRAGSAGQPGRNMLMVLAETKPFVHRRSAAYDVPGLFDEAGLGGPFLSHVDVECRVAASGSEQVASL